MAFSYAVGTTTPGYGGLCEFPSLRINDGTFKPIFLPPLTDTAPLRFKASPVPRAGGFMSVPKLDSWAFEIGGWLKVDSPDDVQAAIDYLRQKVNADQGAMTVYFNAKGWSEKRQMTLRLGGQVAVEDPEVARKKVPRRTFTIPVVAADPRLYAYTATTTAIATGTSLTNAGTTPTPFVVTFNGPQTDPQIDGPGSARIKLSRTLLTGEWVKYDTAAATAVDQSGADALFDMDSVADTLRVGAGSWTKSNGGGAGTTVVEFRSAWA